MIKLKLNEEDNVLKHSYIYTFVSPFMVTCDEDSNSWFEPVYMQSSAFFYTLEYKLSDVDFSDYLDNNKITKMKMKPVSLDGKGYIQTDIYTNGKLSAKEVSDLRRQLIGQFSDGWGESFEQEPFETYYYTLEDDEDGFEEMASRYFHAYFSRQVNYDSSWEKHWDVSYKGVTAIS